jgi:hypothetical protein
MIQGEYVNSKGVEIHAKCNTEISALIEQLLCLTTECEQNGKLIQDTYQLLKKREEQVRSLREELHTIADFAVGNGDVCEIIARRARAAAGKEQR